jgi:DNA-binding response OmpR family regulator
MNNTGLNRALIAEDNALIARALETVLRNLGFEVTVVADGEAARQLMFVEPPDLLIADLGLPSVGGSSLIRWLKAMSPDATVVAISGFDESARAMAMAAGADAFLAKPFLLDELERVIRELVPGLRT